MQNSVTNPKPSTRKQTLENNGAIAPRNFITEQSNLNLSHRSNNQETDLYTKPENNPINIANNLEEVNNKQDQVTKKYTTVFL